MINLIIYDDVAADITDGAEWYRKIDPELAESFLESVYRAIELARATPE
ncbi:MAG: hypothetical protein P1V20_12440 [Verrucomicrobiales bacterium]|nr:hypothetical protein [Verrucomicrobiales bacterium]